MNTIFILVSLYFVSLIPVVYAADKRTVGCGWAALVSLLFSPIIGFLFILCYPTKAEIDFQQRMLRMMNDLPENLQKKDKASIV